MRIDLTGQRFGKLVATHFLGREGKHTRWALQCDCGKTHSATQNKLRRGEVRSCGCARGEHISAAITTHGYAKTPTWATWISMRRRCAQPSDKLYKYYGGRGIKVCDRWMNSFLAFLEDMGERKPGLSLDRIDNHGDYEPGNCRWATSTEQNRNRRNTRMVVYEGASIPLGEACERSGVPIKVVALRLRRGWPNERLFLPKLLPHQRIDARPRKAAPPQS